MRPYKVKPTIPLLHQTLDYQDSIRIRSENLTKKKMKISPLFALIAETLAQESAENSSEQLVESAYDYVGR